MRISGVESTTFGGLCSVKNIEVNRSILKPVTKHLSALKGPEEKSAAKIWVGLYTAGNAGVPAAMAQSPGADEAALAGVEVLMATHIFNGIYDFNFSKTVLKSLATGVAGHAIGKTTFKLASKTLTWIPGIGNALNAIVSGCTTAALGASLIALAEDMDAAKKRGESLDKFIKEMEKSDK